MLDLKQKRRALIVDDNVLVLEGTHSVLTQLGYEIVGEAINGEQAIELTLSLKPDVVLMDIEMPRMNGLDAARQIQESCPTPIVILTAYDTPDFIQRAAQETGVGAYLIKPLRPREVERAITIALARFQDLMELRRLNAELQQALDAIQTLSGLVPICAWCGKKIQDEQGHWHTVEAYIERHTPAKFTHGICPTCLISMKNDSK